MSAGGEARDGNDRTVATIELTLEKNAPPDLTALGLTLVPPFNKVGRVARGSAAARAGLRAADVIVSVDGGAVRSAAATLERLEDPRVEQHKLRLLRPPKAPLVPPGRPLEGTTACFPALEALQVFAKIFGADAANALPRRQPPRQGEVKETGWRDADLLSRRPMQGLTPGMAESAAHFIDGHLLRKWALPLMLHRFQQWECGVAVRGFEPIGAHSMQSRSGGSYEDEFAQLSKRVWQKHQSMGPAESADADPSDGTQSGLLDDPQGDLTYKYQRISGNGRAEGYPEGIPGGAADGEKLAVYRGLAAGYASFITLVLFAWASSQGG